jgi:hypothetical protein
LVFDAGRARTVEPLSTDQHVVLDRLHGFEDEIDALVTPRYNEALGIWEIPTLASDALKDQSWISHPDGSQYDPISLDQIEAALAVYDRQVDGPPGTGHIMSAGLAGTLRALLDDPQLLELVAPRSSDLFDDSVSAGYVDFSSVSNASARAQMREILDGFGDEIDSIKGGPIDGARTRTDFTEWVEANRDNPSIPAELLDAASFIAREGLTDRSRLADAHLTLDLIGMSQIPLVSEAADVLNAGLYIAIDRDKSDAAIGRNAAIRRRRHWRFAQGRAAVL